MDGELLFCRIGGKAAAFLLDFHSLTDGCTPVYSYRMMGNTGNRPPEGDAE
jgi:hypothetical protein